MKTATRIIRAPEFPAPERRAHRQRTLLLRLAAFGAVALAVLVAIGLLGGWWYLRPAYPSLDQELTYRTRNWPDRTSPSSTLVSAWRVEMGPSCGPAPLALRMTPLRQR